MASFWKRLTVLCLTTLVFSAGCQFRESDSNYTGVITTLEPTLEQSQAVTSESGSVETPPQLVTIDFKTTIASTPKQYGSNIWWSDQDAAMWRSRYKELGIKVVRLPMAQGLFEPFNDDADPNHINPQGYLFDTPIPWSGRTITLRKWLDTLRELDVTVMLNVPYLAGWLSANGDRGNISNYPPNNIAEYQEYLRALLQFTVNTVGFPPEKVILEPVNEPDLACGQDPEVTCFWENWQISDLVKVLQAAHQEAKQIGPGIQVVGVAECCGTSIADQLVESYQGLSYLDGFTYHRYVSGDDFSDGIARGLHLKSYGKPVYLNEYGNTRVWSNGTAGALWHADVLPQIWAAGINPLQFPISSFPGMHAGYNELGLFTDWKDGWKIKPSYWVYANFFGFFGGGELVKTKTTSTFPMLASRKTDHENISLVIWLTNSNPTPLDSLQFSIENFPFQSAELDLFDNLTGHTSVQTIQLAGSTFNFDISVPAKTSFCILIRHSSISTFVPFLLH